MNFTNLDEAWENENFSNYKEEVAKIAPDYLKDKVPVLGKLKILPDVQTSSGRRITSFEPGGSLSQERDIEIKIDNKKIPIEKLLKDHQKLINENNMLKKQLSSKTNKNNDTFMDLKEIINRNKEFIVIMLIFISFYLIIKIMNENNIKKIINSKYLFRNPYYI